MTRTAAIMASYDHGQVIEELERADHALTRLLAMSAGRLPQGTA